MILYHYALSPFSSKVRAMLGYAGLDWQSVIVRSLPPRPEIDALAGGYRKIPVAQIGADIFCDSHVIAAEIASLAGLPLLDPARCSAEAQAWIRRVDVQVFAHSLMLSGTLALGRKVWAGMSLREIAGFTRDRIAIGRKARVRANPAKARERVREHLADCEARLTGQDWLFGDQPCHADFSAWHSLWFIHELAETGVLADFPRVRDWYERLRAAGQGGRRQETTAAGARALALALAASPREIPGEYLADPLIGREVMVAPDDYALDPTTGQLAGVTPTRWILARETPEGHRVH
ncbi:MAG: glutathione S-transferase family protein, partial [Perlucidibaca sp.]